MSMKTLTSTLGFKMFTIFVLSFLLLIPMFFVSSIVDDRESYQDTAIDSVIEPMGGKLQLDGILVVVPYLAKAVDEKTGVVSHTQEYSFYMPENYSIDGEIDINTLNRGIFTVPIFSSELKIKGNFEKYKVDNYNPNIKYQQDRAFIIIGTRNKKSFLKTPDLKIDGKKLEEYEYYAAFKSSFSNTSFVFKLPKKYLDSGFNFDATIDVQGGDSISIRPLKSQNTFSLTSKWADPSFSGGWIPTKREVTKDGFSALWEIAGFHTSLDKSWTTQTRGSSYSSYSDNFITTSFLLLNDNYQKTTRSTKYPLLFIFIPFFALFLCEMLSKKPIHIIQYCLIGLANVIFFLLLLSMSEYLSFNLSYLIGAIMVTSIVSLYTGYILTSRKLGIIIASLQSFVYIFLFGIIQLANYSLLIGTFGLFIAIALTMYLTRNINWFNSVSKEEN